MEEEKEAVVLIVHSEGQLRDLLSRVLENDFTCVTASGVQEAKGLVSGVACDVVLTDLPMADEDGVEFAAFIHENFPETVVIGVTSENDYDSSPLGLFDCLRKPIDIARIRAAVTRGVAYRNCKRDMDG
jgi:DNA-binding NtrC family response regulator